MKRVVYTVNIELGLIDDHTTLSEKEALTTLEAVNLNVADIRPLWVREIDSDTGETVKTTRLDKVVEGVEI